MIPAPYKEDSMVIAQKRLRDRQLERAAEQAEREMARLHDLEEVAGVAVDRVEQLERALDDAQARNLEMAAELGRLSGAGIAPRRRSVFLPLVIGMALGAGAVRYWPEAMRLAKDGVSGVQQAVLGAAGDARRRLESSATPSATAAPTAIATTSAATGQTTVAPTPTASTAAATTTTAPIASKETAPVATVSAAPAATASSSRKAAPTTTIPKAAPAAKSSVRAVHRPHRRHPASHAKRGGVSVSECGDDPLCGIAR